MPASDRPLRGQRWDGPGPKDVISLRIIYNYQWRTHTQPIINRTFGLDTCLFTTAVTIMEVAPRILGECKITDLATIVETTLLIKQPQSTIFKYLRHETIILMAAIASFSPV